LAATVSGPREVGVDGVLGVARSAPADRHVVVRSGDVGHAVSRHDPLAVVLADMQRDGAHAVREPRERSVDLAARERWCGAFVSLSCAAPDEHRQNRGTDDGANPTQQTAHYASLLRD